MSTVPPSASPPPFDVDNVLFFSAMHDDSVPGSPKTWSWHGSSAGEAEVAKGFPERKKQPYPVHVRDEDLRDLGHLQVLRLRQLHLAGLPAVEQPHGSVDLQRHARVVSRLRGPRRGGPQEGELDDVGAHVFVVPRPGPAEDA
ncbi:MAG: hypothetical protein BJ554DRAFT_1549 [Olpidium bornovanus]|uniref:Uncharacterized protein n=1 Tax=Olpidium bornovanus TaxID=278681 RepID=A0A8H7ZRG2_9FUNG|nr:MAG: hypothetical protein BJ554DRAFT_1549 [Olpidium bornovanus]